MDKYNTLGKRIKKRRQDLKFSQSELANRLCCTQAALSQYENSNREPGLQDLINIANALETTTDYLLGISEIANKDVSIKIIGDYLGLTEATIEKLHTYYWSHKEKTLDPYLQKDVLEFSGAIPGDGRYERDRSYLMRYYRLNLDDYTKLLNEFICSSAFDVLVRCLTSNLYIERMTYDLLKVVAKEYDSLCSPLFESDFAEFAYGLVDDSEDNIRRYSINLFDAQTALVEFCKELTKLEVIKKLDYSESFYRKLHYVVYSCTRPMFETKKYSVEELEIAMEKDDFKIMPRISELLGKSK